MTRPFNQADGNSRVKWQSQYTYIDNLTEAPDASPEAKYAEGLANLNGRNAERARELIWLAMTLWDAANQPVTSEVLFHWLVAMLSGRTARQFSDAEIGQLRECQSRTVGPAADEWAAGVRLIYQLLDSALRPPGTPPGPALDASVLEKQFDDLGEEQRQRLLQLDLFLSGPRRDKMWQDKLEDAQKRQRCNDRVKRAWVFFWPTPAEVRLPGPTRPVADAQLAVRLSALTFAVLVCSFAGMLLWRDAFLGLFGSVVAWAGGIAVAAAELERRFFRERARRGVERSWMVPEEKSLLSGAIDKRFQKYFDRYGKDEVARGLWRNASDEVRRFYRYEIIRILRGTAASIDEIDWYIRYEVHQMLRRGEDGILRIPADQHAATLPVPLIRRAGWVAVILGCALALFALRTYALGLVTVLIGEYLIRLWWLPAALRCRHHAADWKIRDQRQAGINVEFARWKDEWEHRPSDKEMAEWLEFDRTVLLGRALDYFRLPRSRVIAHGFLEKGWPGARKGQRDGGLLRYQRYQIWMFLLAEDGVRQRRAYLDFLNGVLVEREEIVYGYSSIAAVHVTRKRGGQTFELRLTGGEPVKIQVKEPDPAAQIPDSQGDQDDDAASEDEPGDTWNDDSLDIASITNTLHLLEGVAADGRKWLKEHAWTRAWTSEPGEPEQTTAPPASSSNTS